MIWKELDVNDTFWLINSKGELIGTTVYKKEIESYLGSQAYAYTFDIEDEYGYNAYTLYLYINKDYEDVLLKRLVLADKNKIIKGEQGNTNPFMMSFNKLKLLQHYHKHICENIENVSKVVEEGIINLNMLRNRAADYLKLIEKESNNE